MTRSNLYFLFAQSVSFTKKYFCVRFYRLQNSDSPANFRSKSSSWLEPCNIYSLVTGSLTKLASLQMQKHLKIT